MDKEPIMRTRSERGVVRLYAFRVRSRTIDDWRAEPVQISVGDTGCRMKRRHAVLQE